MPPPDPSQVEVLAACSVREPLARFALWLVETLELPHELNGESCCVTIPDDQADDLDGRASVTFALNESPGAGGASHEPVEANGRFMRWLGERVGTRQNGSPGAADALPCSDPRSVYELSDRLFSHYRVEGGNVHLSGCTLEDHPFLRLTYPARDGAGEVTHLFFAPDGTPADADTAQALGLADVCHGRPPLAPAAQIDLLLAAGRRVVESHDDVPRSLNIGATAGPLGATVVWVKRAVGKLQFTIGESSLDLPFDGWAKTLQPPPFVCPATGVQTYHLAATDDGRIAAEESVEACAETGRRVLTTELVTCSVTQKRVLPEFTRICPVTGDPALLDQFAECPRCRQQVSRVALTGKACQGCRNATHVPADDPRMIWLLTEYPQLGRWRRWKLSETASHFIVTGSRLFGRVLVVLDKETLAPQHAATRGRFRKAWLPLDPAEHQDLFGNRATEKLE